MMKKLCLFLLVLMMLTSSFAIADEAAALNLAEMNTAEIKKLQQEINVELTRRSYTIEQPENIGDTEILFRGFPWLTSETDMLANLKPLGYTSSTHGEGPGYTEIGSWEINLKENFYEEESLYSNREIGYWVYIPLKADVKVAGFTISGMGMDFLYGHDTDKVYRDPEHSRMFTATYYFSVADPMSAFTVLKEKMTALYGEPMLANADGSSYSVYHAIWYGANNTAVRLDMRIAKGSSNPSYALQLCYGISNSLDLIAQLQTALINEILGEGSFDGL